jgi:hypothetical protein
MFLWLTFKVFVFLLYFERLFVFWWYTQYQLVALCFYLLVLLRHAWPQLLAIFRQLVVFSSEVWSLRVNLHMWLQSWFISFYHGSRAPVGLGFRMVEASRSHSRHTTFGRTTLDEWSARRRDLHLTTHNTHNRHHAPAEFEPKIPASEGPQTYVLDRAATETGNHDVLKPLNQISSYFIQFGITHRKQWCICWVKASILKLYSKEMSRNPVSEYFWSGYEWILCSRYSFCIFVTRHYYTHTQLAAKSDVLTLSSWNLNWKSCRNVSLCWSRRRGYRFSNSRAMRSVALLFGHTLYPARWRYCRMQLYFWAQSQY